LKFDGFGSDLLIGKSIRNSQYGGQQNRGAVSTEGSVDDLKI
jgi:hypothetical protein